MSLRLLQDHSPSIPSGLGSPGRAGRFLFNKYSGRRVVDPSPVRRSLGEDWKPRVPKASGQYTR